VYRVEQDEAKTRIKSATVSLYFQTSENEYILWPASEFNQENPQITTDNGKYSFLVPEGTYYLTVEASNYHSYQSNTFEVREGESIHENIELKVSGLANFAKNVWSKYWWQIIVGFILLIVTLIIVIIIVVSRLRKK